MITKKELIEAIKHSPDDAIITVLGQGEIVHIMQDGNILLSAQKPIGLCLQCGEYVYAETNQGLEQYPAFCPSCDENKFSFEFKTDMSEMRE